MNTSPSSTTIESSWKTYLKAVGFLLPALVLWAFASVYFAPKLQDIWAHGGGPATEAQWVMDIVTFLVHHGPLAIGVVVVVLLLFELRSRLWARYRRAALGSVVLFLNSAVLIGLWFMCMAALFIAPALIHTK